MTHRIGQSSLVADPLARVVSLADFEALARERMPGHAFDYIFGGSWDEVTLVDNVAAFRRRRLRPRVLVDVVLIDPSTEMLGTPVSMPVGLAPTAQQAWAHPDGESASMRAATAAGIVSCLSTVSSHSLEEVASAVDGAGSGPRWFQLYVHKDRILSGDLVQRAAANGYSAIVLTVDLPIIGHRERDMRNELKAPERFGNFGIEDTGREEFGDVLSGFHDQTLKWDDLPWLRGLSDLPLVVKGILTAEDAALAVEHGADAIVVSNHGGRQLDRAPATLDVLEECVEAVDGRAEVYVDGGVRRGVDVLTALALGAQAVFIGRPYVYALAVGGEAGVARAIELLRAELVTAMALLGVPSIAAVTRAHVR